MRILQLFRQGEARKRKSLFKIMAVLATCFALVMTGVVPASAANVQPVTAVQATGAVPAILGGAGGAVPATTVRAGLRWGQVDILLDSWETERAAKSFVWGSAVACWNSGLGGKVLIAACIPLVTTCAAQAYLSSPRKRAAMTVTIWGYGWCWKY